jgi:hypothetical protein
MGVRENRVLFSTVCVLALLSISFIGRPLQADIYKYVDSDGTIRYTNELARVPEERLSTVEQYKEFKGPETKENQENPWPKSEEPVEEGLDAGDKPNPTVKQPKSDREKLLKERERLEEERKKLIVRRNVRKSKWRTRVQIKKVKDKIAEIDKKLGTEPAQEEKSPYD